MSAERAPKRRSSSVIERSQYAPNRQPQVSDRRRDLEALGRDQAATERAKQEIAQIARQQRERASAPLLLDDLDIQQRRSPRMVVGIAPTLEPAPDADEPPAAADTAPPASQASAIADLPPAVATTKQVRAKTAPQPAVTTTKQVHAKTAQQPTVGVAKQTQANASASAARSHFEYVEHQNAQSATPARPAYQRDERYVPHEMYHYWEAPMTLMRNYPLVLMLLVALVSVPVILMLQQTPKTTISPYKGAEFVDLVGDTVNNAIIKVFGGDNAAFTLPAIDVPAGEHSILGQPSITEDQIEAVLTQYNSPARGTSKIWFALGQKYGIDPAYPLAFFVQESTAGTNRGWAGLKSDGSTTHNVGNIICAGYATCYKGNRDYPSWEAGIDDWYRLIAHEYVQGRRLASVEQILPIYCPISDGCRSYDYIAIVNSMVEKWQQGQLFQ